MSTPTNAMQQLLAPWMTGASSSPLDSSLSQYGGYTGLLAALMQGAGPNTPQARQGAALANAPGLALQNALGRQQVAQGSLTLQQNLQTQAMLDDAMKRWQAQGAAPPTTLAPQGAPPGQQGNSGPPAQSGPGQQPLQLPSASGQGYQQPKALAGYTADQISQIPISGIPPDLYRAMAMRQGKYGPPVEQEIRNYQLQVAQQQAKPTLDALDTLIKSPYDPRTAIGSNPLLQQAWQRGASLAGLNVNDFSDPNKVRLGLAAARNELAGNAQLPAVEPAVRKVEWKDVGNKLVPVYADTGEDVPGLQPKTKTLTPMQAAGGGLTDDAKELAWQQFKVTHQMPQTGRGGALQQAEYANYFAMRAKQDGDSGADIAARGQQFKATQGVLKDFESGATAKSLDGLNTAVGHMDILDKSATALENSDWRTLNRFKNFFKTEFGDSAVTNFNVVKDFAAGEVAKAVLPGGGGEVERQGIASAIANANSPQILHDAIAKWKELLASKTDALRNRWDVTTNGTQGAFDRFLMPATRQALGIADQSPASSKSLNVGQSQTIGGFTVTRAQ